MKKSKKSLILRNLLLVIISLLIGFGIYSWNARSLTGNVMPMPFGFGVGVVMSGSMEPDLSVDDLIFVVKRDDYQVHQVVVFQDGYSLVVHEVIEKNGDTVVTQGKANTGDDGEIKIEAIKGEVVFSIPGVGKLVAALKSPLATLGMLALAVWLLVKSYRKEQKSEDETLEQIKEEIRKLKEEQLAGETAEENKEGPKEENTEDE